MTRSPVDVLVVDDLPEQRLTIEVTLAELGERVISVSSGREALKYLLDHDVAVILLDVNMPDMDGFETAELIRKRARSASTPIIFLTADHDAMRAARGYELGAVDYLTCPFPPDVLRTKVGVFVTLNRAQERIREDGERAIAFQREQVARAAAEEQGRRMRLLGEAGEIVAGSLDGAPFEDGLLQVMVPRMAHEASVRFADPADGKSCVWATTATGASRRVEQGSVELAGLSQSALTTARIAFDDYDMNGRPRKVALPLTVYDRTMAVLAVARDDTRNGYTAEERELLRLIAERTAVALDNRRLYRELQDRDRRKDEFLAMLSHELRNPLGAISSAAHLLHMLGSADEDAVRASQVISRQSSHLSRMVDDLLDVSRVTAGRITLTRSVHDLYELAGSTITALRAANRLDDHVVTLTGKSVQIEADAARMEQVITNLVVNAAKYSDPGGRIAVQVDADADHAFLRVIDDGIGISPELLPNMFDLFVQGGQSLDRGQGGLGVGLTLVRKLVELQGGTVQAESEGAGKGSTFLVQLPHARHSLVTKAPQVQPATNGASLRVLLVDDNEDMREMLRAFFRLKRHEVHEAADGLDAVETALRVEPDLALVDLGLPGIDGLEVARRLRSDARTKRTVLVAITGYGQPEDRERSAGAGFEAHLVKPVSPDRLEGVIELAIALRAGAPAPAADHEGHNAARNGSR